MGRLTVRLPDTLHQQLTDLAAIEGVSLNQYIVYALTRQTTLAYSVRQVSEPEIERQRSEFAALLESLGQASAEEAAQILRERELVEPENSLEKAVIDRLQNRIADYS